MGPPWSSARRWPRRCRRRASRLGLGKVKVVYDGQGQPSSVEVTDAALGEGAARSPWGGGCGEAGAGQGLGEDEGHVLDYAEGHHEDVQADMK